MLCAHTVRRLRPGALEAFQEGFVPDGDAPPEGWRRFVMLRSLTDENQVITFGFFDGTLAELEASQADHGYEDRRGSVDELVEEVVLNGVYEVVTERG